MENNKTGRPPNYTSVKEIEKLIEKYFEECKGHPYILPDGAPLCDKYGQPVIVDVHPPTVTGLALALGFNSRQSLLNYQAKPEFMDTITRAKAYVERYAEERLFDKDGANGAKFSLANNFEGWKEKQQVDMNSDVNINIELSDD